MHRVWQEVQVAYRAPGSRAAAQGKDDLQPLQRRLHDPGEPQATSEFEAPASDAGPGASGKSVIIEEDPVRSLGVGIVKKKSVEQKKCCEIRLVRIAKMTLSSLDAII